MILQPSLLHHKASLPSTLSNSRPLPFRNPHFILLQPVNSRELPTITCSISQIHSYGTVDYEKKPIIKWIAIYRKIFSMKSPELGAATVLNEFENKGKVLTKWELCRIVKELRKYKRYSLALQVYDWMNNRGERYRLSTSDAAIQLDLIAKVRGVPSAEDFFSRLPDKLKDKRIYGALLNSYVGASMREQAESLIEEMRGKGYAIHALPFNTMMTLYMNFKDYGKVDSIISEMMEKNIQLDIYSYNIWLSSCGAQGSAKRMEQVFEQMKLDKTIYPNWTTFSTMASMYIKMGQFEKAEECLRRVEGRITGKDRIPFHYLLSLYGLVGKKEEVYRVWNTYKSVFPSISNFGYHALMACLIRLGDIDGAEKIYEEWLVGKRYYDPRIANLLIGVYVKEGNMDKAESFLSHMDEEGGKPNSNTWEILAEGYIGEKRILEALSCFREAYSAERSKSWRLRPRNMSAFSKLCEEEADLASKEVLVELLRQSGHLEDELYASHMGLSSSVGTASQLSTEKDGTYNNEEDENEGDGSEILLNEIAA